MRTFSLAARGSVAAALAILAAALLLAALPPAAADAARTARRCAKGAVAVRARSGPRICVRTRASDPLAAVERLLPPTRARRGVKQPSTASKRIAKRALALALRQAGAGRSLLDAGAKPRARGLLARAAANEHVGDVVEGIGRVTSYARGADGVEQVSFRHEGGIEVEAKIVEGERYEFETRDRSGAGWTFGGSAQPRVPQCPTAAGDVPTPYVAHYVAGKATVEHGKRTWVRFDVKAAGRWLGHVGVGARAERFDVDLRASTEQRGGVEIASTGKVLKRSPTRTYRTVLRKRGIAVGTDPLALVRDVTLRGPKGTRFEQADVQPATALMGTTLDVVSNANHELRKGDERWYEQRACARVDHTSTPARVVKGGRADWDVTAYAHDGAVVADARWTPTSSCGALTASGTTGPSIQLGVVDAARGWGIDTGNGACAEAELTTTAGRPQPFSHAIPPEPRRRLRLDISVRYTKGMGPGIAETHMRGSGTVLLGDATAAGEVVMGSGEYNGTEWAQTPENSCGMDMLRTRDFAGRATVGAQRNDDGTITVAFTADERPFEMAWIVVLPESGGTEVITSTDPFCGQPSMAAKRTELTVATREIVDGG